MMQAEIKILRSSLMAAALVLGTSVAANAQGQTPVPTPDNAKGSIQQQEMKRNSPSAVQKPMTTGSGAAAASKDSTKTKAGDPQKKSMDDPKQYGHPDKH